jgi:hypothetical protein
VNVGQGPLAAWRTYKAGGYPLWDGYGVNGKFVRLGTYGDPAAVPVDVWRALLRDASGHTGYTHQWQNPALPNLSELRSLCMASVDTAQEAALATQLGWRYFRVVIKPVRTVDAVRFISQRMVGLLSWLTFAARQRSNWITKRRHNDEHGNNLVARAERRRPMGTRASASV